MALPLILVFFALCLGCPRAANAGGDPTLEVGIAFGASTDTVVDDPSTHWNNPSVRGALLAQAAVARRVRVRTGLSVREFGADLQSGAIRIGTHSTESWYISFPVTAEYDLKADVATTPYVAAGFAVDRRIGAYSESSAETWGLTLLSAVGLRATSNLDFRLGLAEGLTNVWRGIDTRARSLTFEIIWWTGI